MASSKVARTNREVPRECSVSEKNMNNNITVGEVWKKIVAGNTGTESQSQQKMTVLEDILSPKGEDSASVVAEDHTTIMLPPQNQNDAANGIEATKVPRGGGGRGKRRAVEEEPRLDKATLQKQRRMIKNRESAARSRERKQVLSLFPLKNKI